MAQCMYCGAEIVAGSKFCTACGAALPVEAEAVAAQQYDGTVQQPIDVNTQPFEQQAYQQPQQQYQQPNQQQYQQPYQQAQPTFAAPNAAPPVNDSGSPGWGVLGFFFPIVGLILFLVWRNNKPNCAKSAIIGAAIGFALGLVSMAIQNIT